MTEFLTGFGLGYLLGLVAGAVAAVIALYMWGKVGTPTISLHLSTEDSIENQTSDQSSENIIRLNPDKMWH